MGKKGKRSPRKGKKGGSGGSPGTGPSLVDAAWAAKAPPTPLGNSGIQLAANIAAMKIGGSSTKPARRRKAHSAKKANRPAPAKMPSEGDSVWCLDSQPWSGKEGMWRKGYEVEAVYNETRTIDAIKSKPSERFQYVFKVISQINGAKRDEVLCGAAEVAAMRTEIAAATAALEDLGPELTAKFTNVEDNDDDDETMQDPRTCAILEILYKDLSPPGAMPPGGPWARLPKLNRLVLVGVTLPAGGLLDVISGCGPRLKALVLQDMKLEALPTELGTTCRALEVLYADNNDLVSLPASLFTLPKLRILSLAGNFRLTALPKTIVNFTQLDNALTVDEQMPHFLDLSGCEFLVVPPYSVVEDEDKFNHWEAVRDWFENRDGSEGR